jgi:hypothetical protein
MDIVLTALHNVGRQRDASRFYAWTLELLAAFPPLPDDACTAQEHTRGQDDPDAIKNAVGYGYVKPAAQGHECGGALFDQATLGRRLHFNPRTVWLVSGRAQ